MHIVMECNLRQYGNAIRHDDDVDGGFSCHACRNICALQWENVADPKEE